MSSHTKSNNINDSYLVQLTPRTYSPTSKNPTYNLHGKRLYYILLFFSSLDFIIAIGVFIFHLFTSKKNINSAPIFVVPTCLISVLSFLLIYKKSRHGLICIFILLQIMLIPFLLVYITNFVMYDFNH